VLEQGQERGGRGFWLSLMIAMDWTGDETGAFAEALSDKFDREGVVVAVAAVDESDTAVLATPTGRSGFAIRDRVGH